MNQQKIAEIAQLLHMAQETRAPCSPVRELILEAAGNQDPIRAAYAVQQCNTQRMLAAGERLVGRKIGLTSVAVQKQLGVDSPDFGMLFADMAFGDGEEIPLSRTLQPKVEAEIALVLERDLNHERHTFADLISATAYALPAIEVVGSRIDNWDIKLVDTIADNASSGAVRARLAPGAAGPARSGQLRDVDGTRRRSRFPPAAAPPASAIR